MRVGVFKFSSCDGCQLAFFDVLKELLKNREIQIEFFLEAQSINKFDTFDVSFVEGSVSTEEEEERIRQIRESSRYLVSIGACAVSGGIQSIRNFLDFETVKNEVYNYIDLHNSLPTSRPISDYVKVDYEVRGCPINAFELVEIVTSILLNKSLTVNLNPVCVECKAKGNICILVLGSPCLGPITASGCGALCPSFKRGCYGCFGPLRGSNFESLKQIFRERGWDFQEFILSSFNSYNKNFRDEVWKIGS